MRSLQWSGTLYQDLRQGQSQGILEWEMFQYEETYSEEVLQEGARRKSWLVSEQYAPVNFPYQLYDFWTWRVLKLKRRLLHHASLIERWSSYATRTIVASGLNHYTVLFVSSTVDVTKTFRLSVSCQSIKEQDEMTVLRRMKRWRSTSSTANVLTRSRTILMQSD